MSDDTRKANKGRPPLPNDRRRDQTIRVRATDEEVRQFELLGGAKWFRAALHRAFGRLKGGKGD